MPIRRICILCTAQIIKFDLASTESKTMLEAGNLLMKSTQQIGAIGYQVCAQIACSEK